MVPEGRSMGYSLITNKRMYFYNKKMAFTILIKGLNLVSLIKGCFSSMCLLCDALWSSQHPHKVFLSNVLSVSNKTYRPNFLRLIRNTESFKRNMNEDYSQHLKIYYKTNGPESSRQYNRKNKLGGLF